MSKLTYKKLAKTILASFVVVSFVFSMLPVYTTNAVVENGIEKKIEICHRTNSPTNPWFLQEVSINAWDPAKLEHGDFIIEEGMLCPPPPVCGC